MSEDQRRPRFSKRDVDLIDGATGLRQPAVVRTITTPADLDRIETAWKEARSQATEAIRAAGGEVQHEHWDWSCKSAIFDTAEYGGISLEVGGMPQGVLLYSNRQSSALLPPDANSPLLYIEFVEAAPWNARVFCHTPKFRPVGAILIREAVRISEMRGCAGRIGLVSLPQSEPFYTKIGMTRIGPDADPRHEGLAYFEFTVASAARFVTQKSSAL